GAPSGQRKRARPHGGNPDRRAGSLNGRRAEPRTTQLVAFAAVVEAAARLPETAHDSDALLERIDTGGGRRIRDPVRRPSLRHGSVFSSHRLAQVEAFAG